MSAVARSSKSLYVAGMVLQFLMLLKCNAITVTTKIPIKENSNFNDTKGFAMLREIGRTLTLCLTTAERWKCLEKQLTGAIDALAKDNSTLQYGDFIIIEQLPSDRSNESTGNAKQRAQGQRSLQSSDDNKPMPDSIATSLLKLAKSRSIRLLLPSSMQALKKIGGGISDAIDGFTLESSTPAEALTSAEMAQAEEGTKRILNGLVDDKLEQFVNKLTVSGSDSNDNLQNDKDKIEIDKDRDKKKNKKKKDKNKKKKTTKKKKKKDKDKDNCNEKDKKKKDKHKHKHKYKDKHKNKYKNQHKKKKHIKEKEHLFNKNSLKGRKKKGKDKNMAMMGGMAMIAMVAQMFLGKVILIAGAAFVMAKIALLVSVLGSLKRGSIGSSGSTEHIVVKSHDHAGGGGGGHEHGHDGYSYESGWHRSMPHIFPEIVSVESKHNKKYYHTPSQATHQNHGNYNVGDISETTKEIIGVDDKRRQVQAGFL